MICVYNECVTCHFDSPKILRLQHFIAVCEHTGVFYL